MPKIQPTNQDTLGLRNSRLQTWQLTITAVGCRPQWAAPGSCTPWLTEFLLAARLRLRLIVTLWVSVFIYAFITPTHFRFNPRELFTPTHRCLPLYTSASCNHFVYIAGTSGSVKGHYVTPENFVCLILRYGFWFVHMRFRSMVRFQFLLLSYSFRVLHTSFPWNQSDCKSLRVSGTRLNISADLNSTVGGMASILPLISHSFSLFSRPFCDRAKCSNYKGITVTFCSTAFSTPKQGPNMCLTFSFSFIFSSSSTL